MTIRPSGGAIDPWFAAAQRGEVAVDPKLVRFPQQAAGGGKPPRAPILRKQLAGGWDPDFGPVDVIDTPEGLLSLDNTRVAVAQELGIARITVRVREVGELLPSNFPVGRLRFFEDKALRLGLPPPRTWGTSSEFERWTTVYR